MDFVAVIEQARALLQKTGRMTYRTLKRQFALDDEALEDLKEELMYSTPHIRDDEGRGLIWQSETERPKETGSQTVDSPVSESPSPIPPTQSEQEAPAGERRQLTVMFCDLVGSTALSEQLDPEDLQALVRTYQHASAEVIQQYDGHIAQYLGDGLLVYFGYPAAHEDEAVRAVRAGLGIVEAMQSLNTRVSHHVQVRIGIHTGLVVIGEMGSGEKREQLALGETPNIAARVQGQAAPNTVVLSTATYHLIQGFFTCQDLGPQALKGLSTPLTLYQVQRQGEAQNRFDVSVQKGLTPLVGREEELELLQRRWEHAKDAEGQVVLLSGEAGIGKSRLVQVLRDNIKNEPQLSVICHCSPFFQNSALYPVIDQLQRFLQLGKDDTPATKLSRLIQALEPVNMTDTENIALLASLLAIPLPDNYPPLQLSPQKQKEKTLQALVTWLQQEAKRQPVRFDIEDLHWADPSTLELLGLLIDQTLSFRILVVLTFRPEFTPPWPMQAQMLLIQLSRLPQRQIAAMIERVTGKAVPAELLQQLIAKSDGVPLYIEEMTKNLLESGLLTEVNGHLEMSGPLPQLAIPTTLQDSFAARLDRLASVRELAQIGAVLGREFSYELMLAVSHQADAALQDGLTQLGAADILYIRGIPPQASYTFKHALLQEAAYQSLLKSQRQQLHAQTAQVLVQRFPETVETHPELIAHHYTQAGLGAQAVPHWQQAGERAAQRFANVEAITHLTAAIDLLKALPETAERAERELHLQVALGPALIATKGYAAPEVRQVYDRAQELARQVGETPQLFPVLWGVGVYHLSRAEYQVSLAYGEKLLTLAQHLQDPAQLMEAHYLLSHASYWSGQYRATLEHGQDALRLYDPQQQQAHAAQYGQDSGVQSFMSTAWALWHLGYPDQALKQMQEGLTLAREAAPPFSVAASLLGVAMIHLYRREVQAAQQPTEAALALSTEHGFSMWLAASAIYKGWALSEQGQAEEGCSLLHEALSVFQATGTELSKSMLLARLAVAYEKSGQIEKGRETVAEALQFVDSHGERFWEAELYRLKGEMVLNDERGMMNDEWGTGEAGGLSQAAEAEACFHTALDVARHQEAKSWELRAAMSLTRLWQQQGKRTQARDLLAPIYDWFTEGFDTADLKDAKAILDQLSA